MNKNTTVTWRQYEAGKEYKRRIGLYENIRRNERYYRGDQWYGSSLPDLPRPVFNVVRRIVDYLIGSILPESVSIRYTDEDLPYSESSAERRVLTDGIELLSKNAAYRYEHDKLDCILHNLLLDAAISGDGILYCWWDPSVRTGQAFSGDIVTETVDNVNVFVSDVNRSDIQSQEYVILAGRDTVKNLRREAESAGVPAYEIKKIIPDSSDGGAGDYADYELEDVDSEKATYLIKFHRENGNVVYEKSTRECVIRRVVTDMRLYPVAAFNWYPTKNSFHGTSPITGMIPNQKFINRAYAMVMKHMTDTAFSKVIYDKSKIPEWSNEVGEAIAAVGGGSIADAVSVVGVGKMQDGYLELIDNAIRVTKELNGATETALGNTLPTNTSAILAMQEASKIPLISIRAALCRCLEELAAIWADMIFCYYPDDRMLNFSDGSGISAGKASISRLKDALITAHVDVDTINRASLATTQSVLAGLMEKDKIDVSTYLSLLPAGVVSNREKLIAGIKTDEERSRDENE